MAAGTHYDAHRKSTIMSNPYERRSYSFHHDRVCRADGDDGATTADPSEEDGHWSWEVCGACDKGLSLCHIVLSDELKTVNLLSVSATIPEGTPSAVSSVVTTSVCNGIPFSFM
jgi:hypothetical protein